MVWSDNCSHSHKKSCEGLSPRVPTSQHTEFLHCRKATLLVDSGICLQDGDVEMRCMFCAFLSKEAEQSGVSLAVFSSARHSNANTHGVRGDSSLSGLQIRTLWFDLDS